MRHAMSSVSSGQRSAAREAQLRSWANSREERRRAISVGYIRSFLRDNPTEGPALVAEVASLSAAALGLSEAAS